MAFGFYFLKPGEVVAEVVEEVEEPEADVTTAEEVEVAPTFKNIQK